MMEKDVLRALSQLATTINIQAFRVQFDRLHNLYGRKLCTEDNVTCDFVVL